MFSIGQNIMCITEDAFDSDIGPQIKLYRDYLFESLSSQKHKGKDDLPNKIICANVIFAFGHCMILHTVAMQRVPTILFFPIECLQCPHKLHTSFTTQTYSSVNPANFLKKLVENVNKSWLLSQE